MIGLMADDDGIDRRPYILAKARPWRLDPLGHAFGSALLRCSGGCRQPLDEGRGCMRRRSRRSHDGDGRAGSSALPYPNRRGCGRAAIRSGSTDGAASPSCGPAAYPYVGVALVNAVEIHFLVIVEMCKVGQRKPQKYTACRSAAARENPPRQSDALRLPQTAIACSSAM